MEAPISLDVKAKPEFPNNSNPRILFWTNNLPFLMSVRGNLEDFPHQSGQICNDVSSVNSQIARARKGGSPFDFIITTETELRKVKNAGGKIPDIIFLGKEDDLANFSTEERERLGVRILDPKSDEFVNELKTVLKSKST